MVKKQPVAPKAARYQVYFSPAQSPDMVLLERVLEEAEGRRGASVFLRNLALKGWLYTLHGLNPIERSLQLRSLDLPEETIALIEAAVPNPALVGLPPMLPSSGTARAATSTAPAAAASQQPGATAPPAEAKATPRVTVPADSAIGKVSPSGGLA